MNKWQWRRFYSTRAQTFWFLLIIGLTVGLIFIAVRFTGATQGLY